MLFELGIVPLARGDEGPAQLALVGIQPGDFGRLLGVFRDAPPPAATAASAGNTEALAGVLFQKYLLPFEAVSILILVAIIGAVVLARKRDAKRS